MTSAVAENAAWGRFEYSLDEKNRVIIPPRLRWFFEGGAVMTIGAPNHIRVYRKDSWEKFTAGFGEFGLAEEANQNLEVAMHLMGNSEMVALDRDGRLTMPRFLKLFAGLTDGDAVLMVALGHRIEMWSRAKWDAKYLALSGDEAAVAMREAAEVLAVQSL